MEKKFNLPFVRFFYPSLSLPKQNQCLMTSKGCRSIWNKCPSITWWTRKAKRTPCRTKNSLAGSFSGPDNSSSSDATRFIYFFASCTDESLICKWRGYNKMTMLATSFMQHYNNSYSKAHINDTGTVHQLMRVLNTVQLNFL